MRSNQTIKDQAGCPPAVRPSLDCFADVICTLDEQGCFTYVNSACRSLWGFDPEELMGKKLQELLAPEERLSFYRLLEVSTRQGILRDVLNHVRCKDGHLQPTIWSVAWQEGSFHCIVRDGTLRMAHEKKGTKTSSGWSGHIEWPALGGGSGAP